MPMAGILDSIFMSRSDLVSMLRVQRALSRAAGGQLQPGARSLLDGVWLAARLPPPEGPLRLRQVQRVELQAGQPPGGGGEGQEEEEEEEEEDGLAGVLLHLRGGVAVRLADVADVPDADHLYFGGSHSMLLQLPGVEQLCAEVGARVADRQLPPLTLSEVAEAQWRARMCYQVLEHVTLQLEPHLQEQEAAAAEVEALQAAAVDAAAAGQPPSPGAQQELAAAARDRDDAAAMASYWLGRIVGELRITPSTEYCELLLAGGLPAAALGAPPLPWAHHSCFGCTMIALGAPSMLSPPLPAPSQRPLLLRPALRSLRCRRRRARPGARAGHRRLWAAPGGAG